jgi:hypothetical protein
MKTSRIVAVCLGLGLLMVGAPLFAHHGNAAYDQTKSVTIKGTVTQFVWANPHAQIYLDVKDAKGNVVKWAVETLSPGKLHRSGWERDSVKPGDQVTITLQAAKSGAPVGFLLKLQFADGRSLGIQEQGQP